MSRDTIKIEKVGNVFIHNGDGLSFMNHLAEKGIKADLIITDLPYGTTRCKWDVIIPFEKMWESINKIKSSKRTPILLHGCEPFSSHLRLSNLKAYKYDWVWDKVKSTGFLNANKQPLRSHEFIHVFYEKQCFYHF